MNVKRHKLLHYALIFLLMFAPLRGVVAKHCDMAAMNVAPESAQVHTSVMPAHDMSAMLSADSMPAGMNQHHCCDNAGMECSGICDLGLSFSLMSQGTSYSPLYKTSFKLVSLSTTILFRELTPPSRPPASLHS